MLRQRIEHATTYSYQQAVQFGRHRLVLRPREGHHLRVECMELRISPAHAIRWSHDIFNNSIATVDFTESANRLEIVSSVTVSRDLDAPADLSGHGAIAWPPVYDAMESVIVDAYRNLSFPDDRGLVENWMQSAAVGGDALAATQELCNRIHAEIAYQRREAKGVQTPAMTLDLKSGSCRDTATLMMDASRLIGLASRFVSGYLDCPASQAGRSSTHAWVEVYLPALGWIGFDPTLGELVSHKHIALGVSQHPRGVMPVSGAFTGPTGSCTGMTAQVKIERI